MASDDQVGRGGFLGSAERLGFDDIEAGAGKVAAAQRGEDGGFLHDVAASGIHDVGAGFHQRDFLRADDAARLGGERAMDGERIGAAQQFIE